MKGLIILLCFIYVNGHMHFRLRIPNGYNVTHPCPDKGLWEAVGHMKASHTPQKNVFGLAFRNSGKEWTRALCMEDSDGDGLSNGEELGDPQCEWAPGTPVPGKVRGHPGFCEQDRETCSSGMTHPDCPNPKAKEVAIKKPRIRLPPGANDHPQTLKFKEMMRRGRLNGNFMGPDRRINFGNGPLGMPQWRGQVSNKLNRPNMSPRMTSRNDWSQPRKPTVGHSVFGQAPRNSRGQFDRPGQPLSLSRDFGLSLERSQPQIMSGSAPDRHFVSNDQNLRMNGQQNTRPGMRTSNGAQVQGSRWNNFNGVSPFMRSAGQTRRPTNPEGLQSQPRTNRISMRGSFPTGMRQQSFQASSRRFLRF